MKKQDRNSQVEAEVERRAAASGVPPELFVYEMDRHHTDERGPRPFVPVKISQMLRDEKYDRSVWPSLLQSALQDGVPIDLAPDSSRIFQNSRTPLADCCSWGDGADFVLILTARANTHFAPFLRAMARPVPVTCATEQLFGYSLQAIEDVLDISRCQADWSTVGGKMLCTRVTAYSFFTARLGDSPIFRTPQLRHCIFVLQPVVDAVEKHQLTGFRFKRVWPHSSISPVVTIKVTKLPQPAKNKHPESTLSTKGKKVAAGFLADLLGSPLCTDDGQPAEFIAYRLPDLSLPSGSIVAADLLLSEAKPFAQTVTPGDYPLTLIAACHHNDERIAFALIQFSANPVVIWQVASIASPNGKESSRPTEHAYGVDSGCGGFCDAKAQEILLNLADPEQTFTKRMEKEMKKSYRHTRNWLHVQTESGSAAIFSSGDGDGQYSSYFGLDQAGHPVALLTDFEILTWPRCPEK